MATRSPSKKYSYDVHPSLAIVQSVIAGLKQKTGRTIEEWIEHLNRGPVLVRFRLQRHTVTAVDPRAVFAATADADRPSCRHPHAADHHLSRQAGSHARRRVHCRNEHDQ